MAARPESFVLSTSCTDSDIQTSNFETIKSSVNDENSHANPTTEIALEPDIHISVKVKDPHSWYP